MRKEKKKKKEKLHTHTVSTTTGISTTITGSLLHINTHSYACIQYYGDGDACESFIKNS